MRDFEIQARICPKCFDDHEDGQPCSTLDSQSGRKTQGQKDAEAHDAKWKKHFITPIAKEMKKRGVGYMQIHIRADGSAKFELKPNPELRGGARPSDVVKTGGKTNA